MQRKKPPVFSFILIIRIRIVRTVQEKLGKRKRVFFIAFWSPATLLGKRKKLRGRGQKHKGKRQPQSYAPVICTLELGILNLT